MTLQKYFDVFSLVVTPGHSWSLVCTFRRCRSTAGDFRLWRRLRTGASITSSSADEWKWNMAFLKKAFHSILSHSPWKRNGWNPFWRSKLLRGKGKSRSSSIGKGFYWNNFQMWRKWKKACKISVYPIWWRDSSSHCSRTHRHVFTRERSYKSGENL